MLRGLMSTWISSARGVQIEIQIWEQLLHCEIEWNPTKKLCEVRWKLSCAQNPEDQQTYKKGVVDCIIKETEKNILEGKNYIRCEKYQ